MAEIAASGICASNGALTMTSTTSSSAENTLATGVCAPASKFGTERFSDPHEM
jgi:hypothetical protein